MLIRLEKFNHIQRQMKFYHLFLEDTLFGDVTLTREWGRIGNRSAQNASRVLLIGPKGKPRFKKSNPQKNNADTL